MAYSLPLWPGANIKRLIPPALLAVIFVGLAAAYIAGFDRTYTHIVQFFGFAPYVPPFVDAEVVLSAAECSLKGIDVYQTNPCDPLNRPHIYSPLLLNVSALGLHRVGANTVGLSLALLFLASIVLLFRPETYATAVLSALAAISYPAAFAIERGQFEIVIFFLVIVFCILYGRSFPFRCLGYLLVLLAGLLKFFPMTLLLLAMKERLARAISVIGIGAGIFLVTYFIYRDEYRTIMEHIPRCGYMCDQVWVGNIFFRFLNIDRFSTPGFAVFVGVVIAFALCITMLAAATYKMGFRASLSDQDTVFFVAGSLLLLTSFIVEANTYYRAMHLLLTLPFLMRAALVRRLHDFSSMFALVLLVDVFFLLWIGPILESVFALQGLAGLDRYPYSALVRLIYLLRDAGWLLAMAGIGSLTMVILFDELVGWRRLPAGMRRLWMPTGAPR
jgi:hypothetical protein